MNGRLIRKLRDTAAELQTAVNADRISPAQYDALAARSPGPDDVVPIAATVIEKCGGARAVSRLVGRTTRQVYRWAEPRGSGGHAGTIPAAAALRLQAAMHMGLVPLVPADFILPADWRPGNRGGEEAP